MFATEPSITHMPNILDNNLLYMARKTTTFNYVTM